MQNYEKLIEELWEIREQITNNGEKLELSRQIVPEIMELLNRGKLKACEKSNGKWLVNGWVKKAIVLYFKIENNTLMPDGCNNYFDKIKPKFGSSSTQEDFNQLKLRVCPGSYVRFGAYIEPNVVIMPSFINTGAYIGEGSMIDTWATVGSCAQIGKKCHISGGVGIGGVLEPIQNNPVIIEDNCFIGARSEIAEGVIVEEGSVISMGVYIGSSTKIVDRETGEIFFGRVPAYSVVVPGTIPNPNPQLPSLYCAVIVKKVDEGTRQKTAINQLLRFD